jgi:hypothetical protein
MLLVILFIRNNFKEYFYALLKTKLAVFFVFSETAASFSKKMLVSNRNETGSHFVFVRR